MKAFLIAVMISIAAVACAAEVAPVIVSTQQIACYKAAMQKALGGLQVTVREVSVRGSVLQVSYEDCNEQESHEFILGAVLTLAAPLAGCSEAICARSFSGGRKLSEVSVAPEDLRAVFAGGLKAGEEARLETLAAETLQAAGLGRAPAVSVSPVASAAPAKAPSVTLVSDSQLSQSQQKALADRLLAGLAEANLENIIVAVDDCGGWVVDFENRTYRSDVDALAAGLCIIARTLPPVQVAVTVKRDEVPVTQVNLYLGDYAAAQGDLLPPAELARRWCVAAGGVTRPRRTLAGGNSSQGKVDVALRPGITYEIGNEADPFQSEEFLIVNADTTLARGWHANVQSSTRLSIDLDTEIDRALLTKTGWVRRDLLATGSVGKFEDGFYGWYGEVQWDRHQHRVGLVANSLSDELEFATNSRQHAFGYYEYEAGDLGLTARLGYGRFVDSNTDGALLSLQRRFGESLVTAEAVWGQNDEEAINFRLSVPMGPRVAKSPSALRLRPDTAFTLEYMSQLGLQADYLQKGQDLASFRGELSAPYVKQHPSRVLGEEEEVEDWHRWMASPSLEGNSGLVRIPTADVVEDGTLLAGISYMDKEHSRVVTASTDAMPVFVGVGLLPNLELVGKVTVFHDVTAFDWDVNTDRSFNAHYRVLPQKRNRPALAIGAQDVNFGTNSSYLGEAQYAVATWAAKRYRLHLGYGADRLSGVFGGVDYALRPDYRLQVMMDYDTEFVNAGLRGVLYKWLTVDLSLLGLSDLGGAVVFKTELR